MAKAIKPLFTAVAVACVLQGCAIPHIENREARVALPDTYQQLTTADEVNIEWAEWFEDPRLAELIELALENNPESAILLQRINMSANEIKAREGEYLPFVSVGAEAETEKVGEFTRDGAVEENLYIREHEEFPEPLNNLRLGLNSSWELDVWHKLRNSTRVATLEYLANLENRKFFVTQLVAEVSRSYFELLALDKKLALLEDMLKVQKNALRTTEALKDYGRTSTLSIARFKAEISKNQSERFLIKQEIVETENKLNLLLGRGPTPIARNADNLLQVSLQKPAVGFPSELLNNRPDLRQAEFELRAAELDIEVAKANFYPSFTLKAGIGLESYKPQYLLDIPESLAWSLSGDMFAPLINRKAIEASYQNASARQIQAAWEYEYAIVRAFSEVSTNLSKLDNLANSFALKQQQIDALDRSVEVANLLFASARGEYLEVLLAQREVLEANSELIDTRLKQLAAMVELYQSLGGGWKQASKAG